MLRLPGPPQYPQVEQPDSVGVTIEIIKDSLDCVAPQASSSSLNAAPSTSGQPPYWSSARAAEAEDHIRDVVYGGIEGLAYVRSLAEFITPPMVI